MDIEFIGKDHHLTGLQALGLKPNPGQALDPLRIVIFGDELGPFPHPTHFMEPASDGPSGDVKAMLGLELSRQCGATPAGAAPAIGPGGVLSKALIERL